MKYGLLTVGSFVSVLYLTQYMHPVIALSIVVGMIVTAYVVNKRVVSVMILRQYARRVEPIIVHSYYPGDPTVRRRAERERELLHQSGNELGVEVIEVIRGYGEHCDETDEEWQERLAAIRHDARVKQHTRLAKENEAFYTAFVHGQEGVYWEVKYK